MKTVVLFALTVLAGAQLTGCGARASAPTTPSPTPPAAITGVDTPKSVSVVTAD